MKKYPPRPNFINYNRIKQLWILIPFCIFLLFCKGGVLCVIFIILFWVFYSAKMSQKEWEYACDNGAASLLCEKKYLKECGFKEDHLKEIYNIRSDDYLGLNNNEIEINKMKEELEKIIYELKDKNSYERYVSDLYVKQKELYNEIMKFYGVEEYSILVTYAVDVLQNNGDLYKTKISNGKVVVDYNYLSKFERRKM